MRFHGILSTYVEALFARRKIKITPPGSFLGHSEITRHIIKTIDKEANMVLVRFLSQEEGKAFVEDLRRFRDLLGFKAVSQNRRRSNCVFRLFALDRAF